MVWSMNLFQTALDKNDNISEPGASVWRPIEATSTDFGYINENGLIIFKGKVDQCNIIPVPAEVNTPLTTDTASFVVSSINPFFAKDSTNVFYAGTVIAIADPNSFEVLPGGYGSYAKDKNYAYYEVNSSNASDSLTPISGADASTFTSLGNPYAPYAKDKHYVYRNGRVINEADPKTFQILHVNKDPNTCYGGYTKDKNHIYYCGSVVPDADPSTFSILMDSDNATSTYARDVSHVFSAFPPQIITGANPKSFVVLKYGYAKDNKHVYGNGDIPLDPTTFAIFEGTYYGGYVKDSQHIFYVSGIEGFGGFLKDVDLESFLALNDIYGKDTQHIYLGNEIMPEADIKTFHIFTPQKEWISDGNVVWNGQWGFAADKNTIYFSGKKLQGADLASFRLDAPAEGFYYDCASDKNHIYDCGGRIVNQE